jgi:hypothetical protein
MAVDIELRRLTQAGTSPKRRQHAVVDRLLATSLESALAKSCARLPMLDRLDPVRDLELVAGDMPQLLRELAELGAVNRDELAKLTAMAQLCRDSDDLVLFFAGD